MPTYINPFTDFGFKYVFGREVSKPFLMDFLNELLRDEPGFTPIVEIDLNDKEKGKHDREARGIVYDILCTSSCGKRFIVEMQNRSQSFYIDRTIYYLSRAIVDQGVSGQSWNYGFMPVYMVSFLNFRNPDLGDKTRTDAMLCDLDTGKPITDKVRFIYIQLPNFRISSPEECVTAFDKWIYTLKNMENMETIPFDYPVFGQLADAVSYARMTPEDRLEYDRNLKAYRDYVNTVDSAYAEGKQEGMKDLIRKMLRNGVTVDAISGLIGMTSDKINALLKHGQ